MRIETYKANDRFEAGISDKLTSSDLSNFRGLLSEIKQSACKVIVLDLSNLDWIELGGLGNADTGEGTRGKGGTGACSAFAQGTREVAVGAWPL